MSRTLYILDLDGLEQLQPSDDIKGKRARKLWTAPTSQAHDFVWLSDHTVAYINGSTLLHFSIDPKHSGRTMKVLDFPEGTEPSGLQYDEESKALVFSAAVWEKDLDLDKTAAGDKAYEERGDSGLVLDDLFVRHWDTWRIPGRIYTLGMTKLNRRQKRDNVEAGDDADAEFTGGHKFENILKGTGQFSQMDAISEFSLNGHRVAVALKPNDISVALHTRMEVHVIDLDKLGKATQLTPGNLGAVSGVEFSRDGSKLAWLQMAEDGYESDKRVVTVHTFEGGSTETWTQNWDRSPDSLAWGVDGTLYGTAEYKGRNLPYHFPAANQLPVPLLFNGSTSVISPLTDSTFLISRSSMQHPTEIFFLDLEEGDGPGHDPHKRPAEQVLQVTHYSEEHIGGRLDAHAPEEIWFDGVDGFKVHAWVLKPRGWSKDDAAGSYPLGKLCASCRADISLPHPRRTPGRLG
jgi:dipeptidyl aminopeptidase/acylaminoacyl peptidase